MSAKFHLHLLHPRIGKMSNNLEKHGEDDVPGHTYPVSGEIDSTQLDDLMGKGFAKRIFTETGAPAPGFANCAPLAHQWRWAKVHADWIGEEGGPALFELTDCAVKDLTLEFHEGRMTVVKFSLYLHPEFGDVNTGLQKWQRQELGELVLDGGERQLKVSDRQAKLPLGGQASGAEGSQSGDGPVGSGAGGSVPSAPGETMQ